MKDLRSEMVKCYWCGKTVRFDDYLAIHSPLLCHLRRKREEDDALDPGEVQEDPIQEQE